MSAPGSAPDVEVRVDAPTGWVVLPLDPSVDPLGWALAAHQHRAGLTPTAAGPGPQEVEVASVLADVVVAARAELDEERDVALALLVDPLRPVLAWADLRLDPGHPADLEAVFGPAAGEGCLDVERTELALPGGPAVRVRLLAVGEDAALLCESVNHLLRPRDVPVRLVLQSRWSAVSRSDELAAAADALAATVSARVCGADA